MDRDITSEQAMRVFGERIGMSLSGGEVIELIGDVGAGKTTLTKGIAYGLGVDDDVQSPSFTISRVYGGRDDIQLAHYDFYRLADPGIMSIELAEAIEDPKTVVIIEWADVVSGVLPEDRLSIAFSSPSETMRSLHIEGPAKLLEALL